MEENQAVQEILKKLKNEPVTINNVEEMVETVFALYQASGTTRDIANGIFWANALDYLKAKWEREHKCITHYDLWKDSEPEILKPS